MRFWLSANSWQPEAAHPEQTWQIGVSEDGFILDLLLYQNDTQLEACSVVVPPPISTYKSYRYTDTERRVNKAPLKSTKEMEKKAAPHCTWHFVTSDDASHSQEEQKQVSRCFVNRGEGGGMSSVSRCYSDTKRKEQVSCSDVINVRSTCWSTSNIAPHEEVVHPDVCICNGCRPHPRIISWWDCRWPVTYFFRIQVFLKLTEH